MGCDLCMVIATLGISIHLVSGQYYAGNVTSPPSPANTITSFSSTSGPFIAAYTYTWSQWITPTTVGTVMVTVNEAANQTWSTTVYHNTDAAGTVTESVQDMYGVDVTVTYPTNYFEAATEMTWAAILPVTSAGTYSAVIPTAGVLATYPVILDTVGTDGACCLPSATFSTTPIHSPFKQTGSMNTEDPRGWLYTLVGINQGDPWEQLGPSQVSSLWTPQALEVPYTGCPHTACFLTTITPPAAASAVGSQAYILATSTTTLSSVGSSSASEAAKASPLAQSIASTSPSTKSSSGTPLSADKPSQQTSSHQTKSLSSEGPSKQKTSLSQSNSPQETSLLPSKSPTQQITFTPLESSIGQTTPLSTESSRWNSQISSLHSTTTSNVQTSASTQESNSADVLLGHTLSPGSSVTIGSGSSRTVIALSGDKTVVQVGTSSPTILESSMSLTLPSSSPSTAAVSESDSTVSDRTFAGQTDSRGSSVQPDSESSTQMLTVGTGDSRSVLLNGPSIFTTGQQGAQSDAPPVLTLWSSTVSPNSASEYIIAGQTLAPSSHIVVSGTTVVDIGGYIWLGLGGSSEGRSSTSGADQSSPGAGAASTAVSMTTSGLLSFQSSTTMLPTNASSSNSSAQASTVPLFTSSAVSRRLSVSVEATILVLVLLGIAGM